MQDRVGEPATGSEVCPTSFLCQLSLSPYHPDSLVLTNPLTGRDPDSLVPAMLAAHGSNVSILSAVLAEIWRVQVLPDYRCSKIAVFSGGRALVVPVFCRLYRTTARERLLRS